MTKTSPCARSTLDVGCGENPYFFHKRLVNYVGIDITLRVLRKVRHNLSDATLICASGSHIPFKDSTFDLAICTEVLEHLQDPEEAIIEIGRVLTNGGAAIISIPSLSLPQTIILWIGYRMKKISEKPFQSPDHVREYARFRVTPHFEKTVNLFKLFDRKALQVREVATVQSLYTSPKMFYSIFLSRTEKIFERILSSTLFGHHTVFKAVKK